MSACSRVFSARCRLTTRPHSTTPSSATSARNSSSTGDDDTGPPEYTSPGSYFSSPERYIEPCRTTRGGHEEAASSMTDLTYTIIDGDSPAGVKNKTATLVTSGTEALLVDAGFTRADGHRLVAAVLGSGRPLSTVVISHADPDFYFGAEVIAAAFPDATFLATPEAAASTAKKSE